MELKHVKGIGPAKQQKLKDAGIGDVEALARCDVAAVAKKSGIKAAQVKEFKQKAVGLKLLEDVRGIGPETLRTLAESGVQSLKDLYEASADRLAAEAKVARNKIEAWQQDAKELAVRVADDAKTPEGRAKLRQEGVEVTRKAAVRTRDVAIEVYERARRDGEAAIAKAKEIQEQAPAKLQEARKRAEKALAEAEKRIQELQEKTPQQAKEIGARAQKAVEEAQARVIELRDRIEQATRTEVEKFKAANEGFLGRLRARFARNKD